MSFQEYTGQTAVAAAESLKSSENGLDLRDAETRRVKYGFNELTNHKTHWYNILARQFKGAFIYILILAAALSFALGESIDGIIIICFVIINAVLGFSEEWHSQKSLALLKQYVAPTCKVRRGGKDEVIYSRELVPGDLIILEAGDIIPADARFIETTDLSVDESVLTGESVPMAKNSGPIIQTDLPIHKAANIGFGGTTVSSGRALGLVIATAGQTELGGIAKLTVETRHTSGFEKGINKFSKFILRMILVILFLLFVVNIWLKGGQADIFELLLFSVALAVSVVPEALPVVTTIALSKGAIKLAKNKVVVKRLSAIEDLGSIEVLCSDKTGTLTENSLSVAEVNASDTDRAVFLAALGASSPGESKRQANNAFDLALIKKLSAAEQKNVAAYERLAEIPFDPVRRRNSALFKHNHVKMVIMRGAPEAVFPLCNKISAEERKKLSAWEAEEGRRGRRTIAVAEKACSGEADNFCIDDEKDLTFVGLISFVDPIKTTAAHAIMQAEKLGVRIKILTGDGPEVAGAVALEVKLIKNSGEVITGAELEALAPAERAKAADKYSVFARVSPQQKFKIIELLQKKYEVGFLGEGINDAPALKIADVGLVVEGASDIARETADIVLLKRSLSVIIDGIREGREIFANTIKYIKATLISNFGNFYAIAIASLLIPFLPMLPVQILLLNLLSDFPMIAIATDTVDKRELRRPRSYNVRDIVVIAMALGVVSTVFDFIFFALFKNSGAAVLQTNWFIGSVLTELVLIFSIRARGFFLSSKLPSPGLLFLSIFAFAGAIILPSSAWGGQVFGFVMPNSRQITIVLGVVGAYFVVTETVKILYYRVDVLTGSAVLAAKKAVNGA